MPNEIDHRRRGRSFGKAMGIALAIAVPPMLAAQILDLVLDDDLPTLVTVALAVPVFVGPVVGGFVLGRDGNRMPWLRAMLLGVVTIGAIAMLGALRLRVADEDPPAFIVPVLALWGAVLGGVGATAGRLRPARTRP